VLILSIKTETSETFLNHQQRIGKMPTQNINYEERPILVFWESTKACLLACKHCRAEAIKNPLPGELTTEEAFRFIDSLRDFGKPYPVLIITGGDPLMRNDIYDLIEHASKNGIPVSLAPSVTPKITHETIKKIKELGVKTISISLDGATSKTHESIRGIQGHFYSTINTIRTLVTEGFTVQINTAVMRDNVLELPYIASIVKNLKAAIWEVFFLIKVGRGINAEEISPIEYEDVMYFLYDASMYGFIVRTVEAPFFRRIVIWRKNNINTDYKPGTLYTQLSYKLKELLGEPISESKAQSVGTRDGKGIIFVAYNGDVYPSGFLPLPLGNIRTKSIVDIYRNNQILKNIRAANFNGRCGICEYKDICGGSRARAYSVYKDPLGEDPACIYIPKSNKSLTPYQHHIKIL
jgi:radical SAM protein